MRIQETPFLRVVLVACYMCLLQSICTIGASTGSPAPPKKDGRADLEAGSRLPNVINSVHRHLDTGTDGPTTAGAQFADRLHELHARRMTWRTQQFYEFAVATQPNPDESDMIHRNDRERFSCLLYTSPSPRD